MGLFEKSLLFGRREHNYANTRGSGGHSHGQKSLQNQFYCIHFVFITFGFHFAFTFMRF